MSFVAVLIFEFLLAFVTFSEIVLIFWTRKIDAHSCTIDAASFAFCVMLFWLIIRSKAGKTIILTFVEKSAHCSNSFEMIPMMVKDYFMFVFFDVGLVNWSVVAIFIKDKNFKGIGEVLLPILLNQRAVFLCVIFL